MGVEAGGDQEQPGRPGRGPGAAGGCESLQRGWSGLTCAGSHPARETSH